MTRVLGIDPGSRIIGYGLVEMINGKEFYIASGCIRLDIEKSFIDRIGKIMPTIQALIVKHNPYYVAIENIFFSKNAASALKLGQARGAAIAAVLDKNLPIAEYSPREVKLALVGMGGATKEQVSFMVRHRLKLASCPQVDAGDALAVALCHLQHMSFIMEKE